MIPQRNLSLISNALARDGSRRIPEAVIAQDYVLAWLLTGLAEHPLREVLAFKGGTALRRCWFADYRFSEDLDFSLTTAHPLEEIFFGLDQIFAAVKQASGIEIVFDRLDRRQHNNSHTFYLRYQGPLPTPNDVKVDITIHETLEFPLCDSPILRTYDEFTDLPPGPKVRVYALQEIMVEKILALSDLARNEPRDLYDLWYLLQETNVQIAELRREIDAKLAFRKRNATGLGQAIANKESRLKRLWSGRLAHQMNGLPEYDGVFRAVLRAIRSANFPEPSP